MNAVSRRLLVFGDYPAGYGNGIGETLSNLLEHHPDDQLFQIHPSVFSAPPGSARGQSIPFELPRRPASIPAPLHAAYAPVLKLQQRLAEQALFALAAGVIREQKIDAVLTYPVTPWILFAALRLRREFPGVRFVFYVMDDWEGHHTCFGLPFTARRRATLNEMVKTANARFACSYRMKHDYEARFGNAWQVLHKGVLATDIVESPRAIRKPWRILYAGGLNVFRADAVLAFCEGLKMFRDASGHAATLTLLGAGPNAQAAPELARFDFIDVEPWVDNETCQRQLAAADLLYLPLSMLPKVQRIADLAMPTKFSEYLAAGRPVIFHVPASSEVQDLARAAGLPLSINSTDPSEVRDLLLRLDREGVDLADYHSKAIALLRREFDEHVLQERLRHACFAA